MLSREATSETYGPRVYSHHINLHYFILLVLLLLFTLHLYTKNTKNIISIRSHSRKWPWRDWQPLSVGCELLPFCAGTRDLRVTSYWIDTLVLKNWGKYLRYCAASPPPLRGKPTLARDVARRISGAVAGEAYAKSSQDLLSHQRAISGDVAGESTKKSTYQVPITISICRITLFAICLSFSSPPLHPCRFIRPLFPNLLLFFPLPFVCSCVSLLACHHD